MDFGTVLRGLGVLRPVLALLGRGRVALLLSVVIAVGWFVLHAGRADAATGGPISDAGIEYVPGAVAFWLGWAGRLWVIGTALSLGLILGAFAVWAVRAEHTRERLAYGSPDGLRDWRLFDGNAVHRDHLDAAGRGGSGAGAPVGGPAVGSSRDDLGS